MKRFFAIGLGVLAAACAAPSSAAPSVGAVGRLAAVRAAGRLAAVRAAALSIVHVSMRASAAVPTDAAGFFSLGSIADISGGDAAARARLGSVTVGRAPLPDSSRELTGDDVALKLRQAGLNPSRDAVIEGASTTHITLASSAAPSAPSPPSGAQPSAVSGTAPAADAASPTLVKRGAAVTIVVEEDGLSITASGVARDSGAAGDAIRVHRDGCLSDITAVVLDSRTVRLEL